MSKPNIKNLTKHIQLSGEQISMICQPLRSHFNISSFVYKRLYSDGRELSLATKPDWLESYYGNELYQFNVLEKEPENYVAGQLLWTQIQTHTPILNAAFEHNIAHGLTLIRPQQAYCELYYLGFNKEDERAGQLLINNIDLLDKFNSYFKWQAQPLIAKAEQHAIVVKDKYQRNQCSVNSIPCYQNQAMRNGFLNEIYKQGLFIDLGSHVIELTKRELQIAQQLLQGKTMREIGDYLFISPRTVEVHMDNLKAKFNVTKKSLLIQMFNKHQADLSF